MTDRAQLGVVAIVVLVLALGFGARQLVEQQRAINSLRTQVSSLQRGTSEPDGTRLTLSSVEGDASSAESDVQNLQGELGGATIDAPDITTAISDLESEVSCLQSDIGAVSEGVGYSICNQ